MGIETENFVSPVDEDFLCLICTLVLDDPIRLSLCEHMFCRKCLEDWMKKRATCPVDRKAINRSHLIVPDRTVVSMLNKLKIKCEFESLGCEDVVQLENWKSHVNNCDLNPDNKCQCIGCGKMMTKKEEKGHKCIEKLEIENVKLKQENNELKYLITDHQSTSETMAKEIEKLNQKIDKQNDLIKELVNKNGYLSSVAGINLQGRGLKEKTTTSINKWHLLSQLPSNLKNRVRLAAVLSGCENASETVFITEDDEAFWLKADKETLRNKNVNQPKKVDGLSNKRIKSLVFGGESYSLTCVLAVTYNGQVLVWSYGGHPLAGRIKNSMTSTVVSGLTGKTIVQVACGFNHALALTEDGEVFAWGCNKSGQLGKGTINNHNNFNPDPFKVTAGIGNQRTMFVACSKDSSFALMDNGDVFSWGANFYGKLGINNEFDQKIPTKIKTLSGIKVRRLACGMDHVLAVADDGSIFSWGRNDVGQLGTGDMRNRMKPVKIGSSDVKFVEVAAADRLSVALSDDNKCWVWGRIGIGYKAENVLLPKLVEASSIHDAIADYAEYQMSWKTIVIWQDL